MTEGTIARWIKQVGEQVKKGDTLLEIETDKATMELESYEDGVIEEVMVTEGQTVPIGQPIARIGDGSGSANGTGAGPATQDPAAPAEGKAAQGTATETTAAEPASAVAAPGDAGAQPAASEQTDSFGEGAQGQPRAASAPAAPQAAPTDAPAAPDEPASAGDEDGVRASPMARRIARERGIDLRAVRGTGPGGRVIRVDVESATPGQRAPAAQGRTAAEQPVAAQASQAQPSARAAPQAPAQPAHATAIGPDQEAEEVPLNNIRRITGQRMIESLQSAPHFFLTSVIDATALVALRKQVNAELEKAGDETRVSVNDLIVKACALTLRAQPAANAAFGGDKILRLKRIHVGIAVATEQGLLVPVVKDADQKSIGQLARESRALIDKSLGGKLSPAEFSGGTFTVSNLGMFGVEHFTAVINPPQAGILAVGAVASEPVAIDGKVEVRERMRVTLSVDHRVLDGADGARWLQKLKALLEAPMRMLVQ